MPLYSNHILFNINHRLRRDPINKFILYATSSTLYLMLISFQPCGLISKLLQILPPEKKAIFVKENISTWFSKIIPVIVHYVSLSLTNGTHCKPLETLESLTKEILPIDYSQHPHWVEILECIYNPQK